MFCLRRQGKSTFFVWDWNSQKALITFTVLWVHFSPKSWKNICSFDLLGSSISNAIGRVYNRNALVIHCFQGSTKNVFWLHRPWRKDFSYQPSWYLRSDLLICSLDVARVGFLPFSAAQIFHCGPSLFLDLVHVYQAGTELPSCVMILLSPVSIALCCNVLG